MSNAFAPPGIPSLASVKDPSVKAFLQPIKEIIEVRESVRGDPIDGFISFRDLMDAGLISVTIRTIGAVPTIHSITPTPPSGEADYTIPPPLTNLDADGALANIILTWDEPTYSSPVFAYAEVWSSATDNLGTAVLIGTTPASSYADSVGFTGATKYYWVRAVSAAGVVGPYNAVSGVSGTTGFVVTGDIANASITTAKIADGAVTTVKYADASITTTKIGDSQVSTAKIADSSVTTSKIGDSQVTTLKIGDLQITTDKLGTGAITTVKIADDQITAPKILADAVVSAKIAAGAVVAGKIATNAIVAGDGVIATAAIGTALIQDGAIVNAKIGDLAVDSAKVAAAAIVTAKIADATITGAKIASATIAAANIANATITSTQIALATITAANIVDATITGAKIGSATITAANIANATITGSLLVNGTITGTQIAASTITASNLSVSTLSAITADLGTITAGNITLDTSGYVKGGQTAYNTGTGFFLGYSGSAYKFSIGSSTNYLTWDGSVLSVKGVFTGADYAAGSNVVIGLDMERFTTGGAFTGPVKSVRVTRSGTVTVDFDIKTNSGAFNAEARIYKNGSAVGTTRNTTSTSYVTYSEDISVSPGDSIELMLGTSGGATCYCRNFRIKASQYSSEYMIADLDF